MRYCYHIIFVVFFFCYIVGSVGCSFSNIKELPSIHEHFQEKNIRGGFILLDNTNGLFYLSNVHQDTLKREAAGSVMLLLSLVALEENIIANENAYIDETAVPVTDIRSALGDFQPTTLNTLLQLIPTKRLRHWIDSLHYGERNTKTTSPTEYKLSIDEQLGLIKRLYYNQLPFATRTNRIIKKSLPVIQIEKQNITFLESAYTKNSTTHTWNMGWVEKGKDIYLFATYGNKTDDTGNKERFKENVKNEVKRITFSALEELNIISNQ